MVFALQQEPWWWCPMCGYPGAGGWAMMFFMTLFWLVLIGVVVWLIYRLTLKKGTGPGEPPERPEEIVKARYARGEIDANTYHQMMDELKTESGTGDRSTGGRPRSSRRRGNRMREDDVERQGLPPDQLDAEEPLPVPEPDAEPAERDVERLDPTEPEIGDPGEVTVRLREGLPKVRLNKCSDGRAARIGSTGGGNSPAFPPG
jgi:putative membrane protein